MVLIQIQTLIIDTAYDLGVADVNDDRLSRLQIARLVEAALPSVAHFILAMETFERLRGDQNIMEFVLANTGDYRIENDDEQTVCQLYDKLSEIHSILTQGNYSK